jgi:hypothetical protein
MKSIEEFFSEQNRRNVISTACDSQQRKPLSPLHDEVLQAANRGFQVFPEPEMARLFGQQEQLIDEASNDTSRLEEFAALYTSCLWRVALDQSRLCVIRLDGPEGRASLAKMSEDEADCLTLSAQRGDAVWIFFWRPKGVFRASARKVAPGVMILADGNSCPIPPSAGTVWLNPWAEIESAPCWLKKLVFEIPDGPPVKALPVPTLPLAVTCRSRGGFEKQHRSTSKAYPNCKQAGFRGAYLVVRRR